LTNFNVIKVNNLDLNGNTKVKLTLSLLIKSQSSLKKYKITNGESI